MAETLPGSPRPEPIPLRPAPRPPANDDGPFPAAPARRVASLRWQIGRDAAAFLVVAGFCATVILLALGVS